MRASRSFSVVEASSSVVPLLQKLPPSVKKGDFGSVRPQQDVPAHAFQDGIPFRIPDDRSPLVARAERVLRLHEVIRKAVGLKVWEILARSQPDADRFDARLLFDQHQDISDDVFGVVGPVQNRQDVFGELLLVFRPLALGDVRIRSSIAKEVSLIVGQRKSAGGQPDGLTVFMQVAVGEFPERLFGGECREGRGFIGRPILWMKEIVKMLFSDDVFGRIAEHPFDRRARVGVKAVGIGLPDPFAGALRHLPEPFFAVPQLLFDPLLLGDVGDETFETHAAVRGRDQPGIA